MKPFILFQNQEGIWSAAIHKRMMTKSTYQQTIYVFNAFGSESLIDRINNLKELIINYAEFQF